MFNMVLKPNQAVTPGDVENLVHHDQEIEKVFFAIRATFDNAHDISNDCFNDRYRGGNNQGTESGTADYQNFVWLVQGQELTTMPHISAQNRSGNDYGTYKK
jgi:hypothetical protein